MLLPDNDYQILNLTDNFHNDYPNPPYVEILKKKQRPYNCLLFQSHYDYFICIPYRSEITHAYAYHFKNSARSRQRKSGLDYTKIVIYSNLKSYKIHKQKRRTCGSRRIQGNRNKLGKNQKGSSKVHRGLYCARYRDKPLAPL
jgi:hypothetical protein